MKEIKVIDLLTRVYQNEAIPTKIVFQNMDYTWDADKREYIGLDNQTIGERWNLAKRLSDLVYFYDVTEPFIPKLSLTDSDGRKKIPTTVEIVNKINDIIDYLKEI